jgi:anti-anti-sigma regulatory factor
MLRVTIEESEECTSLILEGKLAGVWINEVEATWQRIARDDSQTHIVVDLCGVTFIDANAKQLLKRMRRTGVEFRCCGPDISATVEEIERSTLKRE